MTSDKILRASIFILAFLVGLLRENVAHGKESWQVRHEVEGIREYQLQNGLKVLLFPDHSKATITVNMTYFVGSRHEGYGEAGMAHLLEHMLFRSTRTRTHIMQLLEEKSGDFNGMTWPDGTLYYETLPATPDNLEFALSLEADRMLNSRITADDLRTEFSVVRNEFEMDENNPQDVLREQMLGVAYQWHGYGRATIGNKSDIENVSAERLREFYKRYYQTDNAMLIVAGQFEEADAKKLIEKYFSPMPKPQRPLQATYTTEPVQEGERQLTIRRAGDQATVGLMYHTVAGGHPEAAAVAALVAMLAEQPQGLLYKELVEEGLASEVEGSIWNAAEPGVISFFAKAAKGQKPEKLALRMIEILETLQPDQLNLAHLKRYQQHASRNFTLSFNSNETAVNLSEWAAMGDWRLFFANRDSVRNLTLNAVGQARRFLQASNRTLGYFLPTDQPARVSIATHTGLTERLQNYEAVRSLPQGERFAATWPEIIARTETFQLSNGLKVAILPKQSRGAPVSMVLNVSLRHDPSLRQQKVALRWLPELMVLGTEKLDNAAFDDALAGHQAYIQGQSEWNLEDPGRMRLAALTVGEHSSAVLDLLLDTLQAPRLAAEEWRLLKAEALSALKEEQQDPSALAWREHLRSMAPYRDDDPRSIPSLQKEYDELEAMPLTLIQKTQASLLQYGEAQLVIIGAVNPRDIKAQLERRLARWKPQPEIHFEHFAYFESQGRQLILPTPDKKGAQIVAGLPLSLRDDDPDYPALKLGALIWGGTMGSRLVQRLRHHDGLSYGADGEFNPGIQSSFGTFSSSAMCAPQNVARAIQGLHEELDRLLGQGITTQELSEARNAYLAQRKQALSDDSNLLELILKNLQINRPLDFEAAFDQKLEQVQAVDIQTALKKWIKPEQLILIQALDQALVGQAS